MISLQLPRTGYSKSNYSAVFRSSIHTKTVILFIKKCAYLLLYDGPNFGNAWLSLEKNATSVRRKYSVQSCRVVSLKSLFAPIAISSFTNPSSI